MQMKNEFRGFGNLVIRLWKSLEIFYKRANEPCESILEFYVYVHILMLIDTNINLRRPI